MPLITYESHSFDREIPPHVEAHRVYEILQQLVPDVPGFTRGVNHHVPGKLGGAEAVGIRRDEPGVLPSHTLCVTYHHDEPGGIEIMSTMLTKEQIRTALGTRGALGP